MTNAKTKEILEVVRFGRDAGEGRYLRLDEARYAILCAKHAAFCFGLALSDRDAVPWAILSLHSMLQSSLVAHLTGTAQVGALSDDCAKKTLAALDNHTHLPKPHLAAFGTLVSRLTDQSKRIEEAGSVLPLSAEARRALIRLNDLRNEFAHFKPQGWSLEISGIEQIALETATVVEAIANAGWAFRNGEDEDLTTLRVALASISGPRAK